MKARDLVAVILASAIGAVMVLVVGSVVFSGRSISAGGSEALMVVGGAIVGALSGYLLVHRVNGGK